MSYRFLAAVSLLAVLPGCGATGDGGNQGDPAAAAASDDPYLKRMAGLNEKERNVVLFRAVRDAGRACQRVERSVATDPVQGRPAWVATCDDGGAWLVALGRNGIATVADARALAGRGAR